MLMRLRSSMAPHLELQRNALRSKADATDSQWQAISRPLQIRPFSNMPPNVGATGRVSFRTPSVEYRGRLRLLFRGEMLVKRGDW